MADGKTHPVSLGITFRTVEHRHLESICDQSDICYVPVNPLVDINHIESIAYCYIIGKKRRSNIIVKLS